MSAKARGGALKIAYRDRRNTRGLRLMNRSERLAAWPEGPILQSIRRMAHINVILVVACALVDADKRVLIARRPPGKTMAGLWEFPGGKVEPGERPEETVIRELSEELGITVKEPCLAPFTFTSHTYPDFQLLMPLYVCRRWEDEVTAR